MSRPVRSKVFKQGDVALSFYAITQESSPARIASRLRGGSPFDLSPTPRAAPNASLHRTSNFRSNRSAPRAGRRAGGAVVVA